MSIKEERDALQFPLRKQKKVLKEKVKKKKKI